MTENQFKNTVTLITGASKGIGLATAQLIHKQGGHVIGLARQKPESFPGEFFCADLIDEDQTTEVLTRILQNNEIDHLVNNAGKTTSSLLQQTSSKEFNDIIQINMRAPMQILQACLPGMTRKGYGRVVNISSRAALGMLKRTAYAGAKSGIVGMTKTWALELGPLGITVNAIAPGPIATELYIKNNPMTPEQVTQVIARIPVRRLGTPDDVARSIAFFLAPEAGFITGQVLYTCGGLSVGAASS